MTDAIMTFTPQGSSCLRIEANSPLRDLSAGDVERLIAELAKFRRNMAPEASQQLASGYYGDTIADPAFAVHSVSDGARTLSLRHPGIGWLAFRFEKTEAEKLGHALLG